MLDLQRLVERAVAKRAAIRPLPHPYGIPDGPCYQEPFTDYAERTARWVGVLNASTSVCYDELKRRYTLYLMGAPSVSRNRAPVRCLACPEDYEAEGIATVGGVESERGSQPILEDFLCQYGHELSDLTPEQERETLDSAREWLADGREALRDAAWDQRMDEARDYGR